MLHLVVPNYQKNKNETTNTIMEYHHCHDLF